PSPTLSNDLYPKLPDITIDILLIIFELLPLPSQACLALSCKTLHAHFGFILKDAKLTWPRLLATKSYEVPLAQPNIPRNQLLLLLEDDRWLYCSGCLKLHPHNLFSSYSRSSPPQERRCMYQSGVIDLCPCLALTFFDRMRLEQWLRTGFIDALSPSTRHAFQLTVIKHRICLLHRCSMTEHAEAFIDLTIMMTLEENSCLKVQTRYHLHMSIPQRIQGSRLRLHLWPLSMESIFLCPHFTIMEFLFNPHGWSENRCKQCDTNALVIAYEN
ncbi:hypothetical protein BO71DRAFT_468616, partial [Aspergillus ellipticus CBS 707.79]